MDIVLQQKENYIGGISEMLIGHFKKTAQTNLGAAA